MTHVRVDLVKSTSSAMVKPKSLPDLDLDF